MTAKKQGPRHLAGALKEARGATAGLYARAGQLQEWERHILKELPAQAAGHVRLARVGRDALVLVADGPEWRHRLRYLAPRLQEVVVDQAGIRPQQVTIKVGNLPRRPEVPKPRTLSHEAGRTINAAARHADNPRLAEALARLASRASDSNEN